jgi:hypothetical protein
MTKKGEMTVDEIRNLVRQHNKLTHIDPGLSRAKLISAIERSGYKIDHAKKKIVTSTARTSKKVKEGDKTVFRRKVGATDLTEIKQSKSGEVKPQKRTVKKKKRQALIKGTGSGGTGGDIFSQMFNDPNQDDYI